MGRVWIGWTWSGFFFFFLIHIQSYYLSDQVKSGLLGSGQAGYPWVELLLPSLLSMLLATNLELCKLLPITPKTWLHWLNPLTIPEVFEQIEDSSSFGQSYPDQLSSHGINLVSNCDMNEALGFSNYNMPIGFQKSTTFLVSIYLISNLLMPLNFCYVFWKVYSFTYDNHI